MSVSAQCPGCGAAIAFHVGSSLVTVCEHCNTVVARTDRAIENLGKTSDLVQTQSPLSLWLGGSYGGVGFQLTGRAQLRHGSGGVWDEWYLAFDNGHWGWLAEAQGRFYLTFRQPQGAHIDPRSVRPGEPIHLGNPPIAMVVAETGQAEMLAARGEIPYRLEIGRRYGYADISGPDGAFGTIDFGEQPAAVFLGQQVTLEELGIAASAGAQHHDYQDPDAIGSPQVSVEGVTCDNCGGALELHAPERTERVACPYCGAMHDCRRGVLSLLAAGEKPEVAPDIALGSEGTFDGESYKVIGFMVRSTTNEWGTFKWSEHLLYNPRAGFRWLTYSDNHWSFLTPVPIGEVGARAPDNAHHRGEVAEYNGKTYRLFQAGEAVVEYVAGEFYWKVEAGQTTYTADYIDPPEMLSGESTGTEINWSLGRYISRDELAKCGLDAPEVTPMVVAPNQPPIHLNIGKVWAGLLALAFAILIWGTVSHDRTEVLRQAFVIATPQPSSDSAGLSSDDPAAARLRDGPAGSKVFFSRPFQLDGGENIEVEGFGASVDNSWLYVQGDLYNEKTGLVVAFDLPIEYYHGYDGGSWAEGSKYSTQDISSVPEGSYILRVAVERSHPRSDDTVQITITQDIFYLRYWILALVFLSVIPIWLLISRAILEQRRWEQSDYA